MTFRRTTRQSILNMHHQRLDLKMLLNSIIKTANQGLNLISMEILIMIKLIISAVLKSKRHLCKYVCIHKDDFPKKVLRKAIKVNKLLIIIFEVSVVLTKKIIIKFAGELKHYSNLKMGVK